MIKPSAHRGSKRFFVLMPSLVALSLLPALGCWANEPSLEGEPAQEQTALEAEPVAELDWEQLQEQFRLAIESIEEQGGPFDVALLEPLQGLADSLSEQGQHTEALQHYARQLHINRINQGLYNESQFQIIEKIIDGNLVLQDWPALNDSQDYYYFVSQRAQTENNINNLANIQRYMDWKLAYIGLDQSRDKSKHFLELDAKADLVMEMGENNTALSDLERMALMYQRALIHYYISIPEDQANDTGNLLTAKDPVPLSALAAYDHSGYGYAVAQELEADNKFDSRQISFAVGARLKKAVQELEKIVEICSVQGNKEMEAMSRIYLADWELLWNKRERAKENYALAFNHLLESGVEKEKINKILSSPVMIPRPSLQLSFASLEAEFDAAKKSALNVTETPNEDTVYLGKHFAWSDTVPGVGFPEVNDSGRFLNQEEYYLDVEFDIKFAGKRLTNNFSPVSSSLQSLGKGKGNVENVEVIDSNTSKDKTRWEALDDIDLLMFRPRLEDGEAVPVKARMRYIFAHNQ